jgi:hypothetical protein
MSDLSVKLSAIWIPKYLNADQKWSTARFTRHFGLISVGSWENFEPTRNYGWNFYPYIWSIGQRSIKRMVTWWFPMSNEAQVIKQNGKVELCLQTTWKGVKPSRRGTTLHFSRTEAATGLQTSRKPFKRTPVPLGQCWSSQGGHYAP